jgi:putative flippase GtrA
MNASRQSIEVVVPVHDEAATLAENVEALLDYLLREFPFAFTVTIADSASTDDTPVVGARLSATYKEVGYVRLEEKGRGRALRKAWLASDADIVAYMDVDLSTNLESFLPLVAPIMSGHSTVAIGTRLVHQAHVRRRLKRELLSRGYNGLVRLLFRAGFSDAQCGFKAIRADAARRLLPLVADDGWLFDTELLLLAERNGLRIHEVPVDWTRDLDSRVDLPSTVVADLAGLWRLRRAFWRGAGRVSAEPAPASRPVSRMRAELPRQLLKFGVVGVANTLLSLLAFRLLTTSGLSAPFASAIAFLVGAVNGYRWNRSWTFAARDSTRARVRYLAVHAAGLGLTSTLVWLLVGARIEPTLAYLLTLAVVTCSTFAANRRWAFTTTAGARSQATHSVFRSPPATVCSDERRVATGAD